MSGNAVRLQAINNVEGYVPPAKSFDPNEAPGEIFGANVFTLAEMRLRLPKSVYKSVVCNIANPDMVGHSGILQAAIFAAQAVDIAIGRVAEAVRAAGGALIITADHGNLEMMRDAATGQPHTAHTVGPVPLVYVGDRHVALRAGGALRDVAPTLLDLLGLPQPAEMSGQSLLLPI